MTRLYTPRLILLSLALLTSLITLGVSAGLVAKIHSTTFLIETGFLTSTAHLTVPAFANFALAVSVITLVVLGAVFVVDVVRAGAATSWVGVELGVVGVLMVLWLAAAADTAAETGGETLDCSGSEGALSTICGLYNATEAFAFITWIILLIYFVLLLTYALIAHSRGHRGVWQSTVRDTDFGGHSEPAIPMKQTGSV